jgi:hypothetical protein
MRDGNRRRVARVGHHERRENQGNESETKQEIDHGFRSPWIGPPGFGLDRVLLSFEQLLLKER